MNPRYIAADALPPHSLESEVEVLGGIAYLAATDPEIVAEAVSMLDAGDFYRDTHQALYRILRGMLRAGRTIDAVTAWEEIQRRGEESAVGGFDAYGSILERARFSWNLIPHARIVKKHSQLRQVIELGNEMVRRAYARMDEPEAIRQDAAARILDMSRGETRAELVPFADAARQALDRIRDRMEGRTDAISTGLRDIDEILGGGLRPGQLVIVAGRPAMGKSALSTNISEYQAIEEGRKVLYLTLEMSPMDVAERIMVSRSGVAGHKVRTGKGITDWEFGRLERQAESACDITFLAGNGLTVPQIEALATRERTAGRLDLLVIDYLGLMATDAGRNASRNEALGRITNRLKQMALTLNIPVLLVVQLNRKAESRSDNRPFLSDLRDSGEIEQDADIVLLIHRPEYYTPGEKPGIAEVIVAKQRNGQVGSIELQWQKELTRFRDLARRDEDEIDWTRN